jgi:hypothetical protein
MRRKASRTSKTTIQRLGIQWGLIATVGMILYFLLMDAFNLTTRTELRVFNLIIQGSAITIPLLQFRKIHGKIKYFQGLALGSLVTLVNVATFAVFIAVFLSAIDPSFMEYLRENELLGSYLNPLIAAWAIFIEGLFSGIFVTFTMMQYLKTSHLSRKATQQQEEGAPLGRAEYMEKAQQETEEEQRRRAA